MVLTVAVAVKAGDGLRALRRLGWSLQWTSRQTEYAQGPRQFDVVHAPPVQREQ